MKKIALISLLICSATIGLSGCSKVGNTNEVSDSANSNVTESETEISIPEDEIPTERVPDIQSADEFEYEIIDGSATITGYTGNSTEIDVPAELAGVAVTKIGTYAFEAEYDVTNITLPDTITLIAEGAFMDCSSLESINIPETVTGIDRGAFVSCTSLAELTIPLSVEYIREEAFTACESMTSLNIENPDLIYENWGLEELPALTISAPEDSAVAEWAESMGKLSE